jgi:hypothetical protein
MYSNSKAIIEAILSGDSLKLESAFKVAIMEKIANKLENNKKIVSKKVANNISKNKPKEKEPLDHQKHFNTEGKVSAKDIFVDKNMNNKLSRFTKSNYLNKLKLDEHETLGEDESGLPLDKFNNIASEEQKDQLKRLLRSGQHLSANNFIKTVLNHEDIT